MKEHALSHIGNGYTGHDDERSQHEAFTPAFGDECQWRGIAAPVAKGCGVIGVRAGFVTVSNDEHGRRHAGLKDQC